MLGVPWEALSTHLAPSGFHSCVLVPGTAAPFRRWEYWGPERKRGQPLTPSNPGPAIDKLHLSLLICKLELMLIALCHGVVEVTQLAG